ncbi:multicopper oxidase family protein [Amycolatopsis balhimycina DSM 5908]|uniref:Multicopper oxidase family protein n=1 Tax=Amycolatopsis balhimycina DSM 5908 TaxID=1081091 RepID=A0A428WWD0_AMYBA|nr:multicopper oxidase family protein [Amycolatopsis balhimycina]RSM47379.1 multicopper oxidase family protein [Amycolatopsis balhimycina DSM 5908]
MYVALNDLFSIVPGLALLLWLIAGYRAGRLTYRPTTGKLRRGARTTQVVIGFATFMLVVLVVATVIIWTEAWDLVEPRVTVMLPLIVAPLAGVFGWTVPRLRRLARAAVAAGDPDLPTPAGLRADASAPSLVVPVHVTAVAALMVLIFDLLTRPDNLTPVVALVFWGPVVLAVVPAWLRQARLVRLRREPDARPLTRGRRLVRLATAAVVVTALGAGTAASWAAASVIPETLSMSSAGAVDYGGGPVPAMGDMAGMAGMPGMIDATTLTGDITGKPDVTFVLKAAPKKITLSDGKVVDGMAFNDQVPGPELRFHQGDLVQITLVNNLPAHHPLEARDSLSLHWHGLDVPNAEDGVPGVTMNAVKPGESYTYRFRAHQVGTFWYHTHNDPFELVRIGLFGSLVVLPKELTPGTGSAAPAAAEPGVEFTEQVHTWQPWNLTGFGTSTTLQRHVVKPGTQVKIRLINTDNNPVGGSGRAEARNLALAGTAYRVTAIDGTDLNGPTDIRDERLLLASGGRYDLSFTMPDHPVRLMALASPQDGELFSPDGQGDVPPVAANAPAFDPMSYGTPGPAPFGPSSRFDRTFDLILDDRLGFYDGIWAQTPTINGASFPDTPMLVVHEGDLVRETIVNRSHNNHPMHLHGHHALVLSRNGQATTGAPYWTDTLDIAPGETYTFAFLADNPGVWMDHCHNLDHSKAGMMMMLTYDNVYSPILTGKGSGNTPD